jgi:glutamate carboxypeptidase
MTTNVDPGAIRACAESLGGEAVDLLGRLVDLQGGTEDKAAVDRVGRLLADAVVPLGFSLERVPQTTCGDHLVLRNHDGDRAAVLVGHMDTTFTDYSELPAFHLDGPLAVGPGTADMRGGLVVIVHALRCLDQLGLLAGLPITIVFNSDEERGSVTSKPVFDRVAAEARCAMVFECGGRNGEVVVGRRGKLSGRIRVEGRAGHAADRDARKASAVLEAAHKTIALEALNGARHGASFNVGRVAGGMASNTFPKRAAIEFDVRYLEHADRQWVEEQVARIAAESAVEGSRASWEWTSERPIWSEQHTAEQAGLLEALRGAAEALGHPFDTEIRWGTSDANLIAVHGVATVDGLGPVGFEDHSEREHIVLQTLVERVQLAALVLAALPA